MKFLDTNVHRWLESVSAIVDTGNVIVFGLRDSNIENTGAGQRIPMH